MLRGMPNLARTSGARAVLKDHDDSNRKETAMANPTPRADALRQMREAKFEAEQRRLKQETSKPAEAPKRKPTAVAEDKPVKAKASPKAAQVAERAEIATTVGTEVSDAAPEAKASVEPSVNKTAKKTAKPAAPKATAKQAATKKAATKKAKTSSK